MQKVVYLDNNATTCVAPEVFEAMRPFLTELYGNPSSIHTFGGQVAAHVEKARGQLAALLGCETPAEVLFTSCGTESDNAAIYSALALHENRRRIVTTMVEHPAVLNVVKDLERKGYEVDYLPVDARGRLNLDQARTVINDNTAVVSVMWANNETGTIFPVEELAQIAHEKGALFHTDAVQSIGKVPVNVKNTAIDMLSLSGHKLHAPKGVGALYIRRGLRFKPFILGGHQESGRRGGTENVASIVGLGVAAELANKNLAFENTQVRALRDHLESAIVAAVPHSRANGDLDHRLSNTSSISFDSIEGEAILLHLNEFGICASSGSACTTGSLEPSHVLRAMGIPYHSAHGTLRFSLSRYTTREEVDFIIEKVPPVIAQIRALSPYWTEA